MGSSCTDPEVVLLATATVNSEVHFRATCIHFDDPSWGEPVDRTGVSTRLSSYPVSAMTFHPFRPVLLVATMDGSIHFLSTATASACMSVETLQIPLLISTAVKAETIIHRNPQLKKCILGANALGVHAARVRAEARDASNLSLTQSNASCGESSAVAHARDAAESIQCILSLRFICINQVTRSSSTSSPSHHPTPNEVVVDAASKSRCVVQCFVSTWRSCQTRSMQACT